jgi:hypothetical protein
MYKILNKLRQLINKLKGREVKNMNVEEVLAALEEIESDLKGFSLVTAVLSVIDKVEALKAKVTPVVENAEVAGEQVAQDVEVAAADVQNASVEPVAPEVPSEPVAPVTEVPEVQPETPEPGV